MNILIVDDESLTRDGIIGGINWRQLGIDQIQQADDGIRALEICKTFTPDILLSDVRMPKFDGIQLALHLQKQYPDICIVFMSGYSDKEYLKAAIKLKAISYIEKPIDLKEVELVLADATASLHRKKQSEQYRSLSLMQSISQLGLQLTQPCRPETLQKLDELHLGLPPKEIVSCFTILIQCYYTGAALAEENSARIYSQISRLLSDLHLESIHSVKDHTLYLYHLFGRRTLSETQMKFLGEQMSQLLFSLDFSFHICIGKQVSSPERLYQSYRTAAITLQHAFFQKENSYQLYQDSSDPNPFYDLTGSHPETVLEQLLHQKDEAGSDAFSTNLLTQLSNHGNLLPNQVRELYYQLFCTLKKVAAVMQIPFTENGEDENIWSLISSSASVYTLNDILVQNTRRFFQMLQNTESNSSYVFMIQNYISTHLADPDLSIKAISMHMQLSTSYICTLFKNETGETLNHFITEARMNRARTLLQDPRNRISEISSMVGFNDSNYFGKAFKKKYGQSPSEFRDGLAE